MKIAANYANYANYTTYIPLTYIKQTVKEEEKVTKKGNTAGENVSGHRYEMEAKPRVDEESGGFRV